MSGHYFFFDSTNQTKHAHYSFEGSSEVPRSPLRSVYDCERWNLLPGLPSPFASHPTYLACLPNTQKNSTIPASRVSPSMRRLSLATRVHITHHLNFRARAVRVALFPFVLLIAFRQRILPIFTPTNRGAKRVLGISLVLNDRPLPL